MSNKMILQYHGVGGGPPDSPYTLEPSLFEAQMRFFKDFGFRLFTVQHLLEFSTDSQSLGLSFDDGYLDNYDFCLHLLEEMHFKATFFVSPGLVAKEGYMDWPRLCSLVQKGHEIGSHSYSHAMLPGLSSEKLLQEIVDSKSALEDQLGIKVKTFSIPYGFYNAEIIKTIKKAGYSYICTSHFGSNVHPNNDRLRRIPIKKNMSPELIRDIVIQKSPYLKRYAIDRLLSSFKMILGPDSYKALRQKGYRLRDFLTR